MKNNLKDAVEFYKLGKSNKAISILKNILDQEPNNLDALFNISSIYNDLNNYKRSKPYLFRYLKLKSNDWEALDMLADLYYSEGDYEGALKTLNKAVGFVEKSSIKELLKEKIESFEDRLEAAKEQLRISVLCAEGLDNFIDDIVRELSHDYWIRKFIIKNTNQIQSAIDWGEIIWLEWANEVAIAASKYRNIKDKKVIIRLHRYEAMSNMPISIDWNNISFLLFVSPGVMKIFNDRFGQLLKTTQLRVLHNGVDLSRYKFEKREKGYNIAYVANMNLRKNPHLLLQIAYKLKQIDPKYKIHAAGAVQDVYYTYYFKYMIKEMNLQDNVVLYGWVDDMESWWEDKDYVLSTSIHEGLPYNIMEGMAKGFKPIIHNFYGSKQIFLPETIFNTVDEAVELITEEKYESEKYRKFIEDNYTLREQIRNIKLILNSLKNKNINRLSATFSTNNTQIKNNVASKNYYNNLSKVMNAAYTTPSKRHNYIFKQFSKLNLKDKSVLEIGCGVGFITEYLCQRAKKVFALDISPQMVQSTIKRVKSSNLIARVVDIVNDDIKGEYDIIIAADVLEHFGNQNLDNVFSKLVKVLNPNGIMYINVPYGRYNAFWKKYKPDILQIVDEVIDLDFLFSLAKKYDLFPTYTNIYGLDHPYQYFETFLVNASFFENAYKNSILKR